MAKQVYAITRAGLRCLPGCGATQAPAHDQGQMCQLIEKAIMARYTADEAHC